MGGDRTGEGERTGAERREPRVVSFLALRVPLALAEVEQRAVRAVLGEGFRFPRADGWHVTLYYFGGLPLKDVDGVRAEMRGRMAGLRAPELTWHGAGAFPRRGRERVLWLGASECGKAGLLEACHRAALETAEARGRDTRLERSRPFVPHVTVARPKEPGNGRGRPRVPDAFYELAPEAVWTPPGIELFESVRGEGSARYETLELFSFTD